MFLVYIQDKVADHNEKYAMLAVDMCIMNKREKLLHILSQPEEKKRATFLGHNNSPDIILNGDPATVDPYVCEGKQ